MSFDQQRGRPVGAEAPGCIVRVEETRVEGAVRGGPVELLLRLEVAGQQVDRSTEIGRAQRRGGPGAAIEDRSPDLRTRKERPRVMGGGVGVLERNAVEGHRVLTVREAAKEGLALAQTDAV